MKKYLPLFIISILILSGCSKDKMLEKRIEKKDGEWKITEINWTIVYQTTSGEIVRSGTTYDAGTFTFDEDDGKYSYTVDTFQRSGSFSWSVNDQNVNITGIKQTFDFSSNSFTQTAIALSGTEPEKNKLHLEGTDIDQEVGNTIQQFALTGTFSLSR
jgi:hypothetical protein